MKILIPDAYFNPENTAFTHLENDLIETWIEKGHTIQVVCPVPTRGIDRKTVKRYSKIKHEELYDGKVSVTRFWAPQEKKNAILRFLRYIWCNFREYRICRKIKDVDVIFSASTPPTNGALCAKLKKKLNCRFVYSLQDIFPDSLVNAGLTKEKSFLWKIGRKIENAGYKAADKIIVISEDFKKNIMKKGVPEDKIEVIYNWVDENVVVPVERKDNVLFKRYGLDKDKFYVTYCGNIGFTQNTDMLARVAKSLENDDIRFVIVGDGACRPGLEKRIRDEHIGNMRILPFQPYADIADVFSLGDCGLIISKAGVGNNSVPSKTWSYMSAQTPIIASFDSDSELQKMLKKSDCGVGVEADDENALIAVIKEAAKGSLRQKGINGRRYIIENLTRKICAEKYAEILSNVLNVSIPAVQDSGEFKL